IVNVTPSVCLSLPCCCDIKYPSFESLSSSSSCLPPHTWTPCSGPKPCGLHRARGFTRWRVFLRHFREVFGQSTMEVTVHEEERPWNPHPGRAPDPQSSPGRAPDPQSSPGRAPDVLSSPGRAPDPQSSPGRAPDPQSSPGRCGCLSLPCCCDIKYPSFESSSSCLPPHTWTVIIANMSVQKKILVSQTCNGGQQLREY
uniref:Uncharacterized protein n=1 Tax=Sinocyclocheilus grahami TaxID=75366 RepID=A0A672NGF5_SINGR